jgi:hypothetical protein
MNVIVLTTFVGLALVGFALAFFVHQTNSESGGEQDALMPLDEEGVRPAAPTAKEPSADAVKGGVSASHS